MTTGKNPITTYQRDLRRRRAQLVLPLVPGRRPRPRRLQPPADADHHDPLILTGLAVAFAFRCGMFNIGGQGQYLSGAIFAVWIGSSFDGHEPLPHVVLAIVVATLAGAALGGHRGVPQGDGRRARGDHDDHAQLDRDLGRDVPVRRRRPAPERRAGVRADLERRRRRREAAGLLGRSRCSRACTSGSSSPSAALVVYWVILNRTTLGYGVKAVGFNPEAARYGGISVSPELLPRDGDLRVVRRARRRDRHPRLAVPARDRRHPDPQVGFIGIAVALLGRNTARRRLLRRRSSSGRSSPARRPATSTRRSSSPSSPRTSRS